MTTIVKVELFKFFINNATSWIALSFIVFIVFLFK